MPYTETYSEATPQTDKWLRTLNSRLEGNRADAGCSILDTGYKNDFDPYFIQHPETSIQYLLPKNYFKKLDSFVTFLTQ